MNATLEVDSTATPGSVYDNFTALVTLTLVNRTFFPATTSRITKHVVTDFLEKYYSTFILALGTVGNLLAFAVLSRKTFRVSTIGIFLRFLTLADLGALYTGVVYFIAKSLFDYDVRKADELSCKFHRWLSYVTCDLSSWALVLVSTARLISIVWPMKRLVTRRRVYVAIVTAVVIIFVVNIPMFVMYSNVYVPETKKWKLCVFTSKSYEDFYNHIWGWIVFLKFTAVPGLILTGLNTALVLSVSRTGKALVKMDEFGGSRPVKAAANTKLMFSRWRRQGRTENDDRSSTKELPDHADTEVYETDLSESGFDNDVDHEKTCAYCGRTTSDKTACFCLIIQQFHDPNKSGRSSVVSGWENNNETPLADINILLKSHDLNFITNTRLQTQNLNPDKDNPAGCNQNLSIDIPHQDLVTMSSISHRSIDTSVDAELQNNNSSIISVRLLSLPRETVSPKFNINVDNDSHGGGDPSHDTQKFETVKDKDSASNVSHTSNEAFRSNHTNSDAAVITNILHQTEIITSHAVHSTVYGNTIRPAVSGNGDMAKHSMAGNGDMTKHLVAGDDMTKHLVAGNGDVTKQSGTGKGEITKNVISANTSTGSTKTSTGSTTTEITLLDENALTTDAVSLASANSGDGAIQSHRKISSDAQVTAQSKIKKSGLRKSNNAASASSSSSKSKSLTRSLLVINTVFLVTTIPISIYMSLKTYLFPGTEYSVEQEVYSTFSNFMMYTNNAINFILYCVTGSRFRQQLQLMFAELYHACRRVFRKLT